MEPNWTWYESHLEIHGVYPREPLRNPELDEIIRRLTGNFRGRILYSVYGPSKAPFQRTFTTVHFKIWGEPKI